MYFNFELSWIIIPLTLFLYYKYPVLRPYLLYFMVYAGLIGTLNTLMIKTRIVEANKTFGKYQFYTILLLNLSLLVALYSFGTDGYANLISFAIMIITLLAIYLTPYWPYFNTKNLFGITYILVYITLTITYMLLASWRLLSTGE